MWLRPSFDDGQVRETYGEQCLIRICFDFDVIKYIWDFFRVKCGACNECFVGNSVNTIKFVGFYWNYCDKRCADIKGEAKNGLNLINQIKKSKFASIPKKI